MITPIDPNRQYNRLMWIDVDPQLWTSRNVVRIPIIAWEFLDNGMMRPRTVNPIIDLYSTRFVIETVGMSAVHGFDIKAGTHLFDSDLTTWLDRVKADIEEWSKVAEASKAIGEPQGSA
jgi:hypothetical protein